MDTVLITVDSLRPDHLGQYGYDRDTFPPIDRLLDNGADLCESAFANGSHSAESIPSFLRSRYQPTLDPSEPSVATALGAAGVETAAIHANAVYDELVGDRGGFDTYRYLTDGDSVTADPSLIKRAFRGLVDRVRPTVERLGLRGPAQRVQEFLFPSSMIHTQSEYVRASTVTDKAVAWLNEPTAADRFLWVHYMDPHRPYGVSDESFAYGPLPSREASLNLMSKAGLRPESVTAEERSSMRDWYDADVRYTGHHVGRLLAELDEDTNVILTADHGDEFGEHGAYFHRNRPYDELIHVPLVVRGPETAGKRHSDDRELVDLGPTVCRWHGIDPPATFRGTDLRTDERRQVFATGSQLDDGPVHAGRWAGWKYIRGSTEELYDLSADPGETNDVADAEQRIAARYARHLDRVLDARAELGVDAAAVDDEETRARLSDLGYLDENVDR